MKIAKTWVLGLVLSFFSSNLFASGISLFGLGSISKSYLDRDEYTISLRASGGVAIKIFNGFRLELRYTNITTQQNKLDVITATQGLVGTISNLTKKTNIYSGGLDIEFLGQKSPVQPFLFVGAGYIEVDQTGSFTAAGSGTSESLPSDRNTGITGNVGAGIRISILQSLALELEAFGYSSNLGENNPLINIYGNVGIRIYL